jgi:hypothetical protein
MFNFQRVPDDKENSNNSIKFINKNFSNSNKRRIREWNKKMIFIQIVINLTIKQVKNSN